PRRSRTTVFAGGLAAAASIAAIGLGLWAATLHHSLSQERSTSSVLRDPQSRRLAINGTPGALVVAPSGDAVLTVSLPKPPAGKTYEAWVASSSVRAAGTFTNGLVKLTQKVVHGDQVMVTLE